MKYLINLFLLYPLILNAATGISKYIDDPDEPVSGSLEGILLTILISILFISFTFSLKEDKDKLITFLGTFLMLIWWFIKVVFFLGLFFLYTLAIHNLSKFLSSELVGKRQGGFFLIIFLICYFVPIYLYSLYEKHRQSKEEDKMIKDKIKAMSDDEIHQLLKKGNISKEEKKIAQKELLDRDLHLSKYEKKQNALTEKWSWWTLLIVFFISGKIVLYIVKHKS